MKISTSHELFSENHNICSMYILRIQKLHADLESA